jgi:hypothetical protein
MSHTEYMCKEQVQYLLRCPRESRLPALSRASFGVILPGEDNTVAYNLVYGTRLGSQQNGSLNQFTCEVPVRQPCLGIFNCISGSFFTPLPTGP